MVTQHSFPKLYKKTATGRVQVWSITVTENTILTVWGCADGSLQESTESISEGKNLGRSNETTPAQQAMAEATSRWEKKLKKGYVQNLSDAAEGHVSEVIEGGLFPMLAHRYDQHAEKIHFPVFVQPKLDGHRCVAVIKNGKATLWSRTRKQITGLPHINAQLERLAESVEMEDLILDGELYNHEYCNNFEELTGFIRSENPKPGSDVVQYHIYDVVTRDTQTHRAMFLDILGSHMKVAHLSSLIPVSTQLVINDQEMMMSFRFFRTLGYEGLMLRNTEGLYQRDKRSYDLQKVKEMADDEFLVVGVERGRGKMSDKAIFVCQTGEGLAFSAKLAGSLDSLRKYLDDPSLAVGKRLTVQYQGMTATGVPRFPVGLRFRDDI